MGASVNPAAPPPSDVLRRTRRFLLRGLPAGEYFAAAVPATNPADWSDPTILEQLSKEAVPCTLAEVTAHQCDAPRCAGTRSSVKSIGGPQLLDFVRTTKLRKDLTVEVFDNRSR